MGAPGLVKPENAAASRAQIKSRERVRDLAEVYTHEREVNAMLDLVASMFPSEDDPGNHDRAFLEPACGDGNFLEAILRRKLKTATTSRYRSREQFEHRVLRCIASIYAIDIDDENVHEATERLRGVIGKHVARELADARSDGFLESVDVILSTNIVRANTLTDAREIVFVAYKPSLNGTFVREWSPMEQPEPEEQLGLFATREPAERQRDEVPVHYTRLALHPQPTKAIDTDAQTRRHS